MTTPVPQEGSYVSHSRTASSDFVLPELPILEAVIK
jgi:hypothetical protein